MTEPVPTGPRITDNREAGRFEIHVSDGEGDELAGHADYQRREGSITFVHTEIDPDHGGQGLGSALVSAALDQVRDEGLEVLPLCPFVSAFIGDHPEYLDLVPEDERGHFGL